MVGVVGRADVAWALVALASGQSTEGDKGAGENDQGEAAANID